MMEKSFITEIIAGKSEMFDKESGALCRLIKTVKKLQTKFLLNLRGFI